MNTEKRRDWIGMSYPNLVMTRRNGGEVGADGNLVDGELHSDDCPAAKRRSRRRRGEQHGSVQERRRVARRIWSGVIFYGG